MAGEDYLVKTKVEADVSNFEKGMNNAEKSLKGFSNKLADNINRLGKKGLVGSIANVTLAVGGLTKSLSTVSKFAKDVGKAINECTEAYKVQEIAERALDVAIQNNPFISGESSNALKKFASEMQKVSNYGDEELIPMMTNLVSLGRTESETMQIMSVAIDMSAGTGISLDDAITQLNATLNGNIGRLGQQNAELKGLTEEELKSGRAVEILGEKFKGLASATIDTSKQLKNIKGDFKEALGQFTLPSSDMWNKFWAEFYEDGIKAINSLDEYMDYKFFGSKISDAITLSATEIAKELNVSIEDVMGDFGFIDETLSALTDKELELLEKFISSQSKQTDLQKRYLTNIKHIQKERENLAEQAQEQAEREMRLEEERKRKAEERAERERQLAEERKRLAEEQAKKERLLAEEQARLEEVLANFRKTWQEKLLNQRIDILETERDRAIQNAEEEGADVYSIWNDYNGRILELKLERLQREKEEALAVEGLTAEDKVQIEGYYGNETKKIYDELGDYKKKKGKEEEKDEESKLAKMVKAVKQYAEKVKQIISKIVSTIKNVFSSSVNIFKKLFDFNTDDALNAILVVEDKILTFFVETLPQMPSFLKSVVQSVKTLLKTLKNVIKKDEIAKTLYTMLKTVGDNLPDMIKDLLGILENLINGAVAGLIKWLDEGGLVTIFNLILEIQKTVERIVSDNIGLIADFLADHVQDIADFLAESMTSANKTLPKLLKAVVSIVITLIEAIAKAFENDEFVQSIIDSIIEVTDAIIKAIPKFISAIVKLLSNIITALIPHLPNLIIQLIKEIVIAIPLIIGDIVKTLGKVFSNIFKKIFTKDFWIGVLKDLAEAIGDIFKLAGTGLGDAFGVDTSSGKKAAGDIGLNVLTGGIYGGVKKLGDWFNWWADGSNAVPKGLAIVGEAGPELVNFGGGEQVLNNRNTNKALASMGGNTNNFNVTFNNLRDTTAFTMMQQLKAYNRQMAINGII